MPSSTVYNKPQTIESFLEPVERVPERYVIQGSIRMLQKPIQLSDHDLRSPRQIATLEIAASSPVIVHSVVRIAGKPEQQFICEKFYEDGNINTSRRNIRSRNSRGQSSHCLAVLNTCCTRPLEFPQDLVTLARRYYWCIHARQAYSKVCDSGSQGLE